MDDPTIAVAMAASKVRRRSLGMVSGAAVVLPGMVEWGWRTHLASCATQIGYAWGGNGRGEVTLLEVDVGLDQEEESNRYQDKFPD